MKKLTFNQKFWTVLIVLLTGFWVASIWGGYLFTLYIKSLLAPLGVS